MTTHAPTTTTTTLAALAAAIERMERDIAVLIDTNEGPTDDD